MESDNRKYIFITNDKKSSNTNNHRRSHSNNQLQRQYFITIAIIAGSWVTVKERGLGFGVKLQILDLAELESIHIHTQPGFCKIANDKPHKSPQPLDKQT